MDKKLKKSLKKTIKPITFIAIALLPFLSATSIMSMDTFLDSFENPENYLCVENDNKLIKCAANEGDYIIIQKSTHPDFEIEENDKILYLKTKGTIKTNIVDHIEKIGSIKRVYLKDDNNQVSQSTVYECQIVGKIVKVVDNNIWNSISLKIWDISINNLNINAIISE